MTEDEDIRNLKKLSPRERQILGMVCSGMKLQPIADQLGFSLITIKTDMGHIYVKLGLNYLDSAQRKKVIFQIYCPLIETLSSLSEPLHPTKNEVQTPESTISGTEASQSEEPASVPPDAEERVPAEIIKMVDEDQLSLITPPKPVVIYIPQPIKQKTGRDRSRLWVVVAFVGVLAIVCLVVGILLGRQLFPGSVPAQSNPPVIMPTEVVLPTSPQVMPEATAIIQQATAVPTNPPPPTAPLIATAVPATISLPFSDTFDNGANPAWNILSGDWLTADGRYTISNADNKWAFSILDDPGWTNYRVKVNVKLESSDEGLVVVIVRYGGSKYLVFRVVQIWHEGAWAFYDGNSFTDIAGRGSIDITTHQFDLELDVSGNEFIAKIDGMETQRISLSGYETGGVGLGINCFYPACSSFGNFQVNPIP